MFIVVVRAMIHACMALKGFFWRFFFFGEAGYSEVTYGLLQIYIRICCCGIDFLLQQITIRLNIIF